MESNASYLWAKLSAQEGKWLPLAVHMRDSATVASYLWDRWISESTKRLIDESLRDSGSPADPLSFVRFLAASHDLGKASPGFQIKASDQAAPILERIKDNGFSFKSGIDPSKVPHATVSMAIMERNGLDRSVAVIAGGHHGAPPSKDDIRPARMSAYSNNTGFKDQAWVDAQNSLLNCAFEISGLDPTGIEGLRLPVNVQDILTGIVIIADWLASNEQFFPLIGYDELEIGDPISRLDNGCARINFPHHTGLVYGSEMSFEEAFGFGPRTFQQMAMDTVAKMKAPGLVVVEAPMGEGKTEAALAIAEMLASRFGQNGLFFGLPTQATANGVFVRVKAWAEKCSGEGVRSISLAHGKSAFNDEYASIPRAGWDVDDHDNEGNLVVHQWFHGKTGMLSDIVVGTVDQVLMAGLKRKHLFLRHLGLAEKVVIIDECHAYDEYMGSYLSKALSWLGALRVPVVVMSATLPPKRREEMMSAYAGRRLDPGSAEEGYPMVTCVTEDGVIRGTSDASGRGRTVSIVRLKMEDVVPEVGRRLSGGGYAGIIVNTVGHAQSLYESMKATYPGDEVVILHSAYTASDRSEREKKLIETMKRKDDGGDGRVIVIGTQVLEQSLDIDFDVMFSEICPIDLLLQRMGRLHRHSNNRRPAGLESPICCVIDSGEEGFDKGTESVYGRYQLMNSRILLGDSVRIPQDVPVLVRSAYSEDGADVPEDLKEAYAFAKKEKDDMMAKKERKAKVYQICSPTVKDLVGWLDNERSDPQGLYAEATVRDTDGSVEVILVRRREDGSFHILGDEEGGALDVEHVPEPRVARRLSDCRIALPHRLIARYGVDKLIDAVRASCKGTVPKVWEDSEWLSGELIQVIDEEGRFGLMGMKFRYDRERGLMSDDRDGVQSVG